MKASILIPAFNAENTLVATLQSCITQGAEIIDEIIVVDDHSIDGTQSVCHEIAEQHPEFNWRLETNPQKGACSARNHALEVSTGPFIQWLDADDLLGPGKIATQLARLKTNPQSLVTSPFRPFAGNPETGCIPDPRDWKFRLRYSPAEWMAKDPMCIPACWLGSRELMNQAGPWDESLRVNQDGEFFCRVIAQSDAVLFDDSVEVFYRREGGGVSQFTAEKAESLWRSIVSMESTALGLEDSERMRQMVSNRFQHFIYTAYPHAKAKTKKAQLKLTGLPAPTLANPNAVSLLSKLICSIFGWRTLTQLRLFRNRLIQ